MDSKRLYINTLLAIGFTRKQAEKIAEGREEEKVLSEEEFLQFVSAWESDRVEPMKPLVEKYGWQGLVERLKRSIDD